MDVKQVLEKAIAEHLGALALDNTRLKATLAVTNATLAEANSELIAVRKRLADLEKQNGSGGDASSGKGGS